MENIYTRIGQKRKKVKILTIEKSRLDRMEEKMLKMEQKYQKYIKTTPGIDHISFLETMS